MKGERMDDYEVMYTDDEERNSFHDGVTSAADGRWRRRRPSRVVVAGSRRPTIIRHHMGGYSRPVIVQQPRRMFGGLSTGELVDMAAQILAAIQPLPGAPAAQGHVETDVENLVVYQTALATHAKRDEQLRTLGGLIGRLLK
jgi:hypothetical protein